MLKGRTPMRVSAALMNMSRMKPTVSRLAIFRSIHQSRPAKSFLYIKDIHQLKEEIGSLETYTDDDIIGSLKAINTLQSSRYALNELYSDKSINEYIQVIDLVFAKQSSFAQQLLREIFLLKLPAAVNLRIIDHYYEKGPPGAIPRDIAIIALRSALYNADYEKAVELTDATVAHPRYIAAKDALLRRGALRLIATSLGITALSKFGVNSLIDIFSLHDGWRHLGSINSMILTYVINSSFFITAVRFGRQVITAGGDYLTWQSGTFYTHWFRHSDELMFCSKIVESDRLLNGGESTPKLLADLVRAKDENMFVVEHTLQPGVTRDGGKVRLLQARDNLEDLRMQAYWMSGGDGFEWVEPDQDPAELKWMGYLDGFRKEGLGSDDKKGLKWADELVEPAGLTESQVSSH